AVGSDDPPIGGLFAEAQCLLQQPLDLLRIALVAGLVALCERMPSSPQHRGQPRLIAERDVERLTPGVIIEGALVIAELMRNIAEPAHHNREPIGALAILPQHCRAAQVARSGLELRYRIMARL